MVCKQKWLARKQIQMNQDDIQENHVQDLYNILQYFRFNRHNFTSICFEKARLTFLERIANESLGAHFPLLIRPRPFRVSLNKTTEAILQRPKPILA